jgi:hypothetical protein
VLCPPGDESWAAFTSTRRNETTSCRNRLSALLVAHRWMSVDGVQSRELAIDDQVLRRLDAADQPALKRYAQRILPATTLDEVFALPS